MKHTPGPWQISTGKNPDRKTMINYPGDKFHRGARLVADCGMSTSSIDEGNAQLIAAAPDMLNALILISKELENDTMRLLNSNRRGDQSLGTTLAWCKKQAEEAIAKAEGN